MIAKLATYGTDRAQAIRRMLRALDETAVLGITTNRALHRRVLTHPAFVAGRYDTSLLTTPLPPARQPDAAERDATLAAAAIARLEADLTAARQRDGMAPAQNPWKTAGRNRAMRG